MTFHFEKSTHHSLRNELDHLESLGYLIKNVVVHRYTYGHNNAWEGGFQEGNFYVQTATIICEEQGSQNSELLQRLEKVETAINDLNYWNHQLLERIESAINNLVKASHAILEREIEDKKETSTYAWKVVPGSEQYNDDGEHIPGSELIDDSDDEGK